MALFENTYKKALEDNAEQRQKWITYKEDNQKCQENLEHFQKKLEWDIQVPLGTKALIPGKMYHTSEVFVSHFQNMYSKCTMDQAHRICAERIKLANENLSALKTEYDLFRNTLEIPFAENAFTSIGKEQEIIEKYDEETEKKWRDKHRENIKKYKQEEAKLRKNEETTKTNADVFEMLDEYELLEELNNELMELDIQDNQQNEEILKNLNTSCRFEQLNTETTDHIKKSLENKVKINLVPKSINIETTSKLERHLINLEPISIKFNHSNPESTSVVPFNFDTLSCASPASFYTINTVKK